MAEIRTPVRPASPALPRTRVYDPRAVWSWALYDFANSPFTTLVVTFIYSTYFTQAIASDPVRGTTLWSWGGVTVSAILIALTSPFLGAVADRGGFRKLFLGLATGLGVVATFGLFFVLPGQVVPALALFVVANVAFELGIVFYNAFLPDIAPPSKIGRVSGYGWGLGYVGGLLALIVALVTLVQPEPPWFGFSTELGENIRATNLLVAGWFVVFSIPIFVFVREDRSRITRGGEILRATVRQLVDTFHEIRHYRQIVRFLVARLVYNDALVTVFFFGGILAATIYGFTQTEILVLGIALNIAAGTGAFFMGYLDDKLGGKRTVEISLWGLIVGTLLAAVAPNRGLFWVGAMLVGIFSGPNQSASRSLMGRFVPDDKENEFFGFFAFSGKATAFMGPFLLGLLTTLFEPLREHFHPQRAGVAIILVLFVVGLLLLRGVDEEEGVRVADRADW